MSRTSAQNLAKALSAAPLGIYIVDDMQRMVFANRACLAWLGIEAEELIGQHCGYHSQPNDHGMVSAADRLAPPPAAFAGQPIEATIAWPATDGALRYRRVRFVPLAPEEALDDGERGSVFAILGAADLSAEDLARLDQPEPDAPELHRQIQQLRHAWWSKMRVDRLWGNDPAIQRVRNQVALAIRSVASPIVIVGPRGSGRADVARTIHRGAALVPSIELTTIDVSLAPADQTNAQLSELVPSDSRRRSDAASSPPALLLANVDQLPPECYAAVLQLALGSSGVRLMVTAGSSLLALAEAEEFPAELAHALGTLVIELPALAKRRRDIPLVAQAILEEVNAEGEKQLGGFRPEALDRLVTYSWPGDLAELITVVRVAHAAADGPLVGSENLPTQLHMARQAARHPRRLETPLVLDEHLAQVEIDLIRQALAQSRDNKSKAARLLGLPRPRLYRRMIHLGLAAPAELPDFRPEEDV